MQYKILVVDDNLINQRLLVAMLNRMGHFVIVADNGEQAVNLYKKNTLDVIFMDYQMPVMNGEDATIKIREFEKQKMQGVKVPIFSVSANLNDKLKLSLTDAGVDDFIPKPITLDALINVIKKHVAQCE